MNYNDNFVLPPEGVLEKMRQDYKAKSASANILNEKSLNKTKTLQLPQKVLNNLFRSNFYRSELRRTTNNRYTRQRLQNLIDRTDRNIDRFGILYGGLRRDFVAPRINIRRDYCGLLRDAISAEIDAIMELFELLKEQTQESILNVLYEMIDERLLVLRELNNLSVNCVDRRF